MPPFDAVRLQSIIKASGPGGWQHPLKMRRFCGRSWSLCHQALWPAQVVDDRCARLLSAQALYRSTDLRIAWTQKSGHLSKACTVARGCAGRRWSW